MMSPVGDGAIANEARERADNDRTTAAAMVGVYCASAAVAAVALAMVVVEAFAMLDSLL
jgi:hypothetical protein